MKRSEADHQLGLALGGSDTPSPHVAQSINRRRSRSLPVIPPDLPLADSGFHATTGVPRTRAECPEARPCPHLRCKYHLLTVDAANRAGRPGLGKVPRDSKGRTLAVTGDAGAARAGTEPRPAWLKVRGLEIEREVKLWVTPELDMLEVREGTLSHWLSHVRPGEPVLVFDDDTSQVVAKATVTQDGQLKLDRDITDGVVMIVLVRVRELESCALDAIDKRGQAMTNEEIGRALARHRTLVAREVAKALRRAVEEAEERGISREDFVATLIAMGKASK